MGELKVLIKNVIGAVCLVLGALVFFSSPTNSFIGALKIGSDNVVVLTGTFGPNKYEYYPLVKKIRGLAPKERLLIILRNHNGGDNETREYISNAIKDSKGTITFRLEGENWSNAALLFRHGHYAVVPYQSVTVYHQASYGRIYTKYSYAWSVREHRKVHAFEFMTDAQIKAWHSRKDIYVKGKTICNSRFVVRQMNGYCVIIGIKRG